MSKGNLLAKVPSKRFSNYESKACTMSVCTVSKERPLLAEFSPLIAKLLLEDHLQDQSPLTKAPLALEYAF